MGAPICRSAVSQAAAVTVRDVDEPQLCDLRREIDSVDIGQEASVGRPAQIERGDFGRQRHATGRPGAELDDLGVGPVVVSHHCQLGAVG